MSIKAGKIILKKNYKHVYSEMCPLNFYCILLQVFDTSPKLNLIHTTETNSSQRSGVWFEGPCPISLSVTQNNCWLVAEGNLEKKIQSSTLKNSTPSKVQNEIKKIIVVLKSKKCCLLGKSIKMSNLILCFSEIPKILFVSA